MPPPLETHSGFNGKLRRGRGGEGWAGKEKGATFSRPTRNPYTGQGTRIQVTCVIATASQDKWQFMLKTLRARNNPTDPVEVRLFLSFSRVSSRDYDSRMIQTHRICYQRVRRNLVAGNDEKYVSKVSKIVEQCHTLWRITRRRWLLVRRIWPVTKFRSLKGSKFMLNINPLIRGLVRQKFHEQRNFVIVNLRLTGKWL